MNPNLVWQVGACLLMYVLAARRSSSTGFFANQPRGLASQEFICKTLSRFNAGLDVLWARESLARMVAKGLGCNSSCLVSPQGGRGFAYSLSLVTAEALVVLISW